ncbi:glycosyltransferase family 4 protein [Faecalicoccus acidiformans]|uniref:glycosyltransferase family 4 protein n=1 Tax=Faecalicoccus acidiformans TaxID=915173 RepID=UPI00320A25AA
MNLNEREVAVKSTRLKLIMYSSADKVDGQGVGSAYEEQVALIREGASDLFDVKINDWTSKPDIQHFHTIDPTFFVKMQDKKAVNIAYCHFLPETVDESLKIPSPFFKVFANYLITFYKTADRLVVVNPCFIDPLVELGIPRENVYYIPNYVSKETFYPKPEAENRVYREKLGIDPDTFVVLGAGQVQTRKGVLDFVKVAESMPDVTFVWAGGFSFGVITEGYDELSKIQKNPPKNVHFLGIVPREEMVNLYNAANVLFVPSYNELFPMTILEAVNVHVPLVLRDLDLYKDILFGHHMSAGDNEGFVACIQSLRENPDIYEKYQRESLILSEFYSKEHVLQMWREFYLSAYGEKQYELRKDKNTSKKKKPKKHKTKRS